MFRQIYHVGLTVSDLDRSIDFYRDVLGLTFVGEILMEGAETEAIFHKKGCKARVAYLNGSEESGMPPVELIQFTDDSIEHCPMDLFRTGISELCFQGLLQDVHGVRYRSGHLQPPAAYASRCGQ